MCDLWRGESDAKPGNTDAQCDPDSEPQPELQPEPQPELVGAYRQPLHIKLAMTRG